MYNDFSHITKDEYEVVVQNLKRHQFPEDMFKYNEELNKILVINAHRGDKFDVDVVITMLHSLSGTDNFFQKFCGSVIKDDDILDIKVSSKTYSQLLLFSTNSEDAIDFLLREHYLHTGTQERYNKKDFTTSRYTATKLIEDLNNPNLRLTEEEKIRLQQTISEDRASRNYLIQGEETLRSAIFDKCEN